MTIIKKPGLLQTLRAAAIIALSAVLLTGLAACGAGANSTADTPPADTTKTPAWASQLVAGDGKTITVGSDTTFPPFESVSVSDGKTVEGFDVDLMTAMAKTMGLEVKYKTYDWDGIIPGLNAGSDFDMVCSALTITPERAKAIYFSKPYFMDSYGMAVPKDSTFADWKQLKAGDKVGVQLGSSGAEWAKKNLPAGVKFVENKDTSALFQAMQAGEVKAIIQDYSMTANFCKDPSKQAKIVQRIDGTDSYLGMGFQKSDKGAAMRDDFNTALKAIVDDGTYARTYQKYFGGEPDFVPGDLTLDEVLAKAGN
ncbi:MAG: transporter substrate-binding domain-containing protein [Actinomycetia bacterium]|nr:transporter substrate-binding domain-containing protein [Actinomycetes bacterium]